jgi:hypothetical protein
MPKRGSAEPAKPKKAARPAKKRPAGPAKKRATRPAKKRPAPRRPAPKKKTRTARRPAARPKRGAPPRRSGTGGSGRARAKIAPRAAAQLKLRQREQAAKLREREQAARLRERALAATLREREQAAKLRERERAQAEKLREKAHAQRVREREAKERKRDLAEKQRARTEAEARRLREKAQADKQRERDRQARDRQRAVAQKARARAEAEAQKLRERAKKDRQREAERRERERDAKKRASEKEQARVEKEREAARAAARVAREAERVRLKAEREAERVRLKTERDAERDRIRDEARRKKDEERAARESEREAYRKAKEAEQAVLRAERETARRALEGRVVKATRASRAAASGRAVGSTRVYTPSSIPDQSRTRRALEGETDANPFANLRLPKAPPRPAGEPTRPFPRTVPPPPPPPPPVAIEERYTRINERLAKTDDAFRHEYDESLLMSWIYHDSALEGVVYTYDELRMAINPSITVVPDSSMQTVCDEIRRHKAAIEFVREQADKKRVPVNIDTVKRIYLILHPEEGDLKTVKYRKDIPQHRLYFHEYAAPDKIAYKVRQVFDWLNGPEPKKLKSTVRIAARAHFDLLRVFPFALDSGKVARLFMNLLLMRADCPPALIHSTERQRYYEALRGQLPIVISMVTESITNALSSIEKKLDDRDAKGPAPA